MLKHCLLSLKKQSPVWVTASLLLLFSISKTMSEPQNISISTPDKLQGKSYIPPDNLQTVAELPKSLKSSFALRTIYIPKDLSDWRQIESLDEGNKVESVRVFIYANKRKNKKHLDITINNPATCKKIASALHSYYMLRPAVSDIEISGGGVGAGACYGILQVRLKGVKKMVIIGVSEVGFWLGVSYGSFRQTFYSKALAVALDQTLKKHTKHHLSKKTLKGLSGSHYFDLPKELTEQEKK